MAKSYLADPLSRVLGQSLIHRMEAWLFSGAITLSRWLGPNRARKLGWTLMRKLGPRLRKHHHVTQNLLIATSRTRDADTDAISREVWGTLGSVIMEYPHLPGYLSSAFPTPLEVSVGTDITAYQRSERSAVFITPHLGNWEIASVCGRKLGLPLSVVYSKISNPMIDDRLTAMRAEIGCGLIEKSGAARAMVRELRAKRSLGLVMDLRPEEGIGIDFFDRPALVPIAAIGLAVRFDADILPTRVIRLDEGRFRVVIEAPLQPSGPGLDSEQLVEDLTKQVFGRFEDWIEETPEQWVCVKRRWPKPGKPVRKVMRGRQAKM